MASVTCTLDKIIFHDQSAIASGFVVISVGPAHDPKYRSSIFTPSSTAFPPHDFTFSNVDLSVSSQSASILFELFTFGEQLSSSSNGTETPVDKTALAVASGTTVISEGPQSLMIGTVAELIYFLHIRTSVIGSEQPESAPPLDSQSEMVAEPAGASDEKATALEESNYMTSQHGGVDSDSPLLAESITNHAPSAHELAQLRQEIAALRQSSTMPEMNEMIKSMMNELEYKQQVIDKFMVDFDDRLIQVKRVESENAELKKKEHLHDELKREFLRLRDRLNFLQDTSGLKDLSREELMQKVLFLAHENEASRRDVAELSNTLTQCQNALKGKKQLERKFRELQKAHLEQAAVVAEYQESRSKIVKYREAIEKQEQVIHKLESLLERSCSELDRVRNIAREHKSVEAVPVMTITQSRDVQTDEKVQSPRRQSVSNSSTVKSQKKHESRYANASHTDDTDLSEVSFSESESDQSDVRSSETGSKKEKGQQSKKRKDHPTKREEDRKRPRPQKEIKSEKPDSPPPKAEARQSPLLEPFPSAVDAEQLEELETRLLEYEMRAEEAENRCQMLEQELEESSRRYAKELATLRVQMMQAGVNPGRGEPLLHRPDEEPVPSKRAPSRHSSGAVRRPGSGQRLDPIE
jgi:hypothetical protein